MGVICKPVILQLPKMQDTIIVCLLFEVWSFDKPKMQDTIYKGL